MDWKSWSGVRALLHPLPDPLSLLGQLLSPFIQLGTTVTHSWLTTWLSEVVKAIHLPLQWGAWVGSPATTYIPDGS